MNIDKVLSELEDAMQYHMDQPITGDFMSLTRAWREILTNATEGDRVKMDFLLMKTP